MIAENQRLIRIRENGDTMTCIVCPIGCRLVVDRTGDTLEVTGGKCRRGEEYAREEFSDPRRLVTGTCAVTDGPVFRLPVRSNRPVPVDRIGAFLNAMYELRLEAPVESGTVVATDVGGTGMDLVATMTVRREDRR